MLVHQILRSKANEGVLTLAPGKSVAEAVAFLSDKKVGAVVISEDGRVPLGILSERDIVRELGRRGAECLQDGVHDMMTDKLTTCTPHDSADQVLEMMTTGRFRHLPVMENDEMVGLISIGDVVKARLSELAMEKDALEGMIMGH
ncbi:Protein containing a CBS domain [Oceanicola granulosus HTCC2516]|uniref:Protein containing a CBS domain n=1 Tax=Oceanicola granulosus (strain ATCC BAA-861 / DSM 15982 / KCTC 12143 / HTCC2516) TaxID=314256 RepID=Q2CA23_OCEGH|nr:CBS domain-containing protein [Oceanicola granulosus]EAR49514.1 Protein containing a CBS domain [Oceanicola granulosus HTCC2516]